METTEPNDDQPDDVDALRDRVRALEAEIARRDEADAAFQSRKKKAATFAGEVAVRAVAGTDVERRTRSLWDAWRLYGKSPRTEPFPEVETREFAVSLLARLTSVRLWYLLAAAIPSAFIAAQTVLLYQQNARFDRQNNLIAFEQTSSLRSLLFLPPYDSLGRPVADYLTIPDSLLYDDALYRWPQPNTSSVDQILAFARNEPEIAFDALLPLLSDDAPPVAIGALIVLGRLRQLGLSDARIIATGSHLAGADLSDLNLRLASLPRADLRGANLSGADLTGADLNGAFLDRASLEGISLEFTNLRLASLKGVRGDQISFSHADLRQARFDDAELNQALFSEAWLFENSFDGAKLSFANFQGSRLDNSSFRGADFAGANLSGASFLDAHLDDADLTFVQLDSIRGLRQAASIRGAVLSRHGDNGANRLVENSYEILSWAQSQGAEIGRPPGSDSLCCEPTGPPRAPDDFAPPPPPPGWRRNPPSQ
ncbi:hypothetical protein B1759_05360 [Rubrivirga sp. SAORIC476]|uniref:pentapeptide repeat-containing protein n=1 Tax=Rubrivirga sp. SAORIC476 TaxID=1961794 RepID=UPI000BA94CE6|nr:pentapeptide repeat-containing protein [Rubrivirga sp. SAORIC476]PAP80799.1 hypothetical protein B1759_05360 [Rubrivirga sp. SAORIC476]